MRLRLVIPFLFVAFAILLLVLSKLGFITPPDDLIANLRSYYDQYGLRIIFVSTLVEGFMFFGLYYPGSILLALVVVAAQGDITTLTQIVLAVWAALSIVSVINFTVGRLAMWSMDAPMQRLAFANYFSFLYFVHPTAIAYLSYQLGANKRSYLSLLFVSFGILLSGIFYATILTFVGMELAFISNYF